jgi:hypothetical protein
MVIQGKGEFKKDHGFSPDRFDAAIHTFFRDDPTREVILPKEQLETKSNSPIRVHRPSLLAPMSFRECVSTEHTNHVCVGVRADSLGRWNMLFSSKMEPTNEQQ